MKTWNKQNLISFAVILAAAVVAFFTIAALFYYFKNGGAFWPIPVPVVAIGYAVVVFVKKYYQKSEY